MCLLSPFHEALFPYLAEEGYEVKSCRTPDKRYNCVAFAADSEIKYWWPDEDYDGYWPPKAKREESIEGFITAYETLGYELCEDGSLESGYEKVAIYVAGSRPTHAAKQCRDGKWKSKLGCYGEDIEHNTLRALEDTQGRHDDEYGEAVKFLRKRISNADQPAS